MAGTQKRTSANRGRTISAVDKDVKALNERLSGLEQSVNDGFATIANLLSEKRAQELNDEIQAQVVYDDEDFDEVEDEEDFEDEPVEIDPRDHSQRGYAKPQKRRRKTPVGERDGDKIIRNIHPHQARFRLGNPRDPYRVILEPRETPGDTDQIPASLVGDINYKRNHGRIFEEITSDEYDALQSIYAGYGSGGYQGGYSDAELIYDEDRTIATMQDVSDPRRRGFGPRYVDVAGSDIARADAARQAAGQEYTQSELQEFQEWKARQSGMMMPDPNDPSGRDTAARLKRGQFRNSQRPQRQRAGGDRESAGMAHRVARLERDGIVPQGELDKPVRLERAQDSVVGGAGMNVPGRRLPVENVPPVPQRRR